jgi:hypothetical protein
VIAGLTVFNGGGRRPVQRMAVVIEITFSVRLVQKSVEITKVVVRLGEGVTLRLRLQNGGKPNTRSFSGGPTLECR